MDRSSVSRCADNVKDITEHYIKMVKREEDDNSNKNKNENEIIGYKNIQHTNWR